MKLVLLGLIFSLFIVACTKADPNAYKSDPILQDYQSQRAATLSQIEGLKKQLDTTKKEIENSVPQSGQRAIHQRKYDEIKDRVDQLEQQVRFWSIRIESRAKEAQFEYLEAYKNKKDWPEKAKVESYFAEKRLRQAKMQWDQKDRIEDYKKANKGLNTQYPPANSQDGQ